MAETMTPRDRITANVRTLMHARGYARNKDLGARLGWSEAKISRAITSGRWQMDELDELAAALRVQAADLLRDPASYLPGGDALTPK
ncbi:helix-turn-helix domain-containing protein [Rhodococcus jostii]|uniref:helix-turn-helix domain-containing protein n=1 Tax=Rhodococcus jostii TaxID=132919 RepID=UPI00363EC20E